ncbi:MAG: 3-hydroxyacyl-CoA dehydrogenase NAD-binding domain-containing protein [Sphingomonadales bacterium]
MTVSWTLDEDVAVILIDNPPVNAASHAVRQGVMDALAAANANPAVRAIVLACAGRTFVAGADVKEFGAPPRPPLLPEVTAALEASAKPVVAALHGTALGGGLELALAAHGRVASQDAKMGLPEVKLGLIPGAGGTQRLPRLVGMAMALEMISGGRPVDAAAAKAAGLVDVVADDDLLAAARVHAQALADAPPPPTGALDVPAFDAAAIDAQIAKIGKKARGQIAPVKAAAMVRQAAELDLGEGLRQERAAFLALLNSPQAKALRYVFAAERQAAKVPGVDAATARHIGRVGVVGAGLMGAGIAVCFLNAGYRVEVVERDQAAADAGRQRIEGLLQRMLKSGRIGHADVAARLGRLQLHSERAALADCDLVIEAVFDDFDVKSELFASLSKIVGEDCILATNTSYLDPNRLAAVVSNPQRFLGLHFFSPATIMRLVEVVRTDDVSAAVLATALALVKKLGKLGVVSGVCEGFIGNRLYTAYRKACDFMLEEGALPHQVDAAMEEFGFAMGPYAVNDMAGLDISWARRKRQAASRDPKQRYVVIADRLCEAGRFGQKTGKGYYRYEDGHRQVDDEVTAMIELASRDAGIARRAFAADEIVARVSAALVAEGQAILQEGIALRASDIDLVLINGYGYPAWRGGPMFEAGLA